MNTATTEPNPATCLWENYGQGEMSTDCGNEHQMLPRRDPQTLTELGWTFCPWCGKVIEEVEI